MNRLATAAASFEQALAELGITGDEEELGDPAELGRRAAVLAASDVVWRKHLGPSYSSRQVRELLRIGSRQAVSDLVKRHRLLALPTRDGRLAFPAFQFTASGRPLPGLPPILSVFADAVESPYTVASWFVTAEPLLEGKTPAEWLREHGSAELAAEAAARYAERLRR